MRKDFDNEHFAEWLFGREYDLLNGYFAEWLFG